MTADHVMHPVVEMIADPVMDPGVVMTVDPPGVAVTVDPQGVMVVVEAGVMLPVRIAVLNAGMIAGMIAGLHLCAVMTVVDPVTDPGVEMIVHPRRLMVAEVGIAHPVPNPEEMTGPPPMRRDDRG